MIERLFEAVLFDLDGTLSSSLPLMRSIYWEFLNKHGHKGNGDEFDEMNGRTLAEIVDALKHRYGLPGSIEVLLEEWERAVGERYPRETKPNSGAQEVLAELSEMGCRLGVVTSAHAELASAWLENHDLGHYFEHVVTGTGKKGKPDPELYLEALALFRVEPTDALAVEDSDNGVLAATSAGITTIRLDESGDGAGRSIRDLRELSELVVVGK